LVALPLGWACILSIIPVTAAAGDVAALSVMIAFWLALAVIVAVSMELRVHAPAFDDDGGWTSIFVDGPFPPGTRSAAWQVWRGREIARARRSLRLPPLDHPHPQPKVR
jgi:uncharacterized protein (DUF58 family)